jgi:hypothetical protein
MGHIDDSGKPKSQGESTGKEEEEGSHGNPVKGLNNPIHDGLFLSRFLPLKGVVLLNQGIKKIP